MMHKVCRFFTVVIVVLQSTSFAFETNSCPQNRLNNLDSLRQISTRASDEANWGARRSTAQTGSAARVSTCTNLDKINQIKQYLNCQSSLSFAACAGVGAAVAGRAVAAAGARYATTIDRRVLLAQFDRDLPRVRSEALKRMHESTLDRVDRIRTGRIGPGQGNLPIKVRIDLEMQNERIYINSVDDILARIRAGIARGEAAITQGIIGQTPVLQLSESFMNRAVNSDPEMVRRLTALQRQTGRMGSNSSTYRSLDILNQIDEAIELRLRSPDNIIQNESFAAAMGRPIPRAVVAAANVDRTALERASLMRAIPRRFPVWMAGGGTVGLAIAAGTEILRPTPTGCDTIGRYPRDPDNYCAPIYQVDQGVVAFLNERPAVQLAELRNPNSGSCNFYKTLHSQMFEQPRFVGLRCGTANARAITLTTRDRNGARLVHTILYNSANKVTQMNVRNEVGSPAGFNRWARTVMFNQDGTFQNQSSSGVVQTVQNTRLYVPDAVNCCLTNDSASKQRCLAEYNR